MPIAREGAREIVLAAAILGVLAVVAAWALFWPASVVFGVVWLGVLAFFRDPMRRRTFEPGEMCAAADGKVTEIAELDDHEVIGGPAVRIGVFLSIFNVHINRAPCSGRVRSVTYEPGEFLDARHPESGSRNEANTLVIEPDVPLAGPVVVRQVAGVVARRIICHAREGENLAIGSRFGLIKFGSRTEIVLPRLADTEITVQVGDKVRAGLTVVARQPVETGGGEARSGNALAGAMSPAVQVGST
jgi:phosphatidylserine decarboxylase